MLVAPTVMIEFAANAARFAQDVAAIKGMSNELVRHAESAAASVKRFFGGMIAGIAAGFSIAAIRGFIDEVVKATGALSDMAERSGATVEGLSALRSVAKLSGTDMGSVEAALVKLAKGMASADDTTKGFGAAITKLGLSARDSAGNLKSTDQMYLEIALKLGKYADGAGKTAAAIELMGKAGAGQLNVMKDLAEVGDLQVKVTKEQADAADEYEKNLKRLSAAKSAIWKQIVIEMIPAMDSLAKFFLTLYQQTGGWRDKLKQLVDDGSIAKWANEAAMGFAKFLDWGAKTFNQLDQWGTTSSIVLANLLEFITRMASGGVANPLSNHFAKVQQDLNAYLDKLKADAAKAQGYYQTIMGNMIAQQGSASSAKPALNFTTGNDDANKKFNDALLKRMDLLKTYGALERTIYEANYAVQKDLLEREQTDLKASLDQRSISERDYIEEVGALRLKLADLNLARLTKEREDAVRVQAEMQAQVAQIRGNDDAANAKRAEGEKKIAEQQRVVVKLLGDEKIATEAVRSARQRTGDELTAYGDKIKEMVRLQQRATEDQVRAGQDNIASMNLQLSLIGANTIEQQTANTVFEYGNKLREVRIAHERKISDLERTKADSRLIDEENASYTAIVASLKEQEATQLRIIPLTEQQKQHVEDLRNAWQAIDSAAFDAFESILTGGQDTWKKLADSLKKTMIRALYELTVQRWTMQIFADLTGASTGAGGVISGTGSTVNTISSLFSGGSSALSAATKGYQWLAGLGSSGAITSAGSALGATSATGATLSGAVIGTGGAVEAGVVGYGSTAVAGEGAALAGAAGAEAGAAAGAAAVVPVVGWVIAIAAIAYAILSANKEPTPARGGLSFTGPYEDSVNPTQTAFGAIGFSDAQTQQFSGQVGKAMTDAIGGIMDLAAKQLKPETIAAVSQTLHDTVLKSFEGTFTTEDFINTFGPTMAKQLLDPVLEAVDPYARQLVDEFKGPFDQMLLLAGDLVTVAGVIKDHGDELNALFGESISLQAIDAARKEGETFSAALQRLGVEFAATNQIAILMGKSQEETWGKVGLASESARAQLIEFAGGADKLTASLASYYDHYFTAAEKQAIQQQQLTKSFEALGETMPATLEDFRKLVEAQDLTTEAGRKEYAGLLALEGQFYNFASATEKASDAIKTLAGNMQDIGRAPTQPGTSFGGVRVGGVGVTTGPAAFTPGTPGSPTPVVVSQAELDLRKQLFDLTRSENEQLARNRQLQLDKLTTQERELGLTEGTLTSIQKQIDAQIDLNAAMQKAAEATKAATDTQASLWEQFATDAQKTAKATQEVNDGFKAMGEAVPKSAEEFANLVASINPATEAGQKFLEFLKGIAPAFQTTMQQVVIAIANGAAGLNWDDITSQSIQQFYAAQQAAIDNYATKLGMLARIYEMTGNATQLAITIGEQHRLEIEKLNKQDPTGELAALQKELWRLEAAAAAAAKALKFQNSLTDLQIQILRAKGDEAGAVALEHQKIIDDINKEWGAGTVEANQLIDKYKELWAVTGNVAEATSSWITSLQDWLRKLQLDSTLSPLTPTQRFDFAQQQYVEDLLKAQSGDADARSRFTSDADAYLRESLAMYGRASTQYEAIWRAIQDQTQGLIDQGLAPTSPATLTDVQTTLQSAQQTAQQQADSMIAELKSVNTRLDSLTRAVEDNTSTVTDQTDALVEVTESTSKDITTAFVSQPSPGARLV